MCEIADKVLAEDGYSLADFLAWKARRTKQPKKTRKEWLNQFKDCGHCQFDSICRKQRVGYTKKYNAEEYVNRIKNGAGIKDCCIWSSDVANALHDKADLMMKEGKLYD